MVDNNWITEIDQHDQVETFYGDLQSNLIDTVYRDCETEPTVSDIWEIIIREGLYQNLKENPSVAIGFLLTTNHGPTSTYKNYLDIANQHQDLVVLVALSALVNDVKKKNYLKGEVVPRRYTSNDGLGDLAGLSFVDKREKIDDLVPKLKNRTPDKLEFIQTYGKRKGEKLGLYDNALIDYIDTSEHMKYVFKSEFNGFAVGDKYDKINPTAEGCAFHVVTNKRVLSVVGIKNSPDEALFIPISSIEKVDILTGWTKNRIKIKTKEKTDHSIFHIWIPEISVSERELKSHIENKKR